MIPCRWTDTQTNSITKLTVIFRNCANAPENIHCFEDTLHLLLQAVHEIRHVIRRHGIRGLSFAHRRCLKIQFFWHVILCRWVRIFRRFDTSYCFTQKLKALQSSATPVTTEQTTRGHIPHNLYLHDRYLRNGGFILKIK